jgi:hypothetical protein
MRELGQDGGGAEGDRTPDLLIANEALSQLSYSPVPRSADNGEVVGSSQASNPPQMPGVGHQLRPPRAAASFRRLCPDPPRPQPSPAWPAARRDPAC